MAEGKVVALKSNKKMSSQKLGIFNNLSKPFVKLVERYYPDAFIFVIVLSVLTFFGFS